MSTDLEFEAWWVSEGQYLRAGGGGYEKTFAFHAWIKARQQSWTKYKCLDCEDTGVNVSNGYDCRYCFGDLQSRGPAASQAEIARLRGALSALELSANTVARCYTHLPENFASALQSLESDAAAARELLK